MLSFFSHFSLELKLNFLIKSCPLSLSYCLLFVWGFSSHLRIFHSYGDVTITGEGLQILTYAQHLWPFSSEGSLACHTYCDTAHPFIIVIFEDPCHSHLLPSIWQCSWHQLFLQLGYVAAGIWTPNFCLWGESLTDCATAAASDCLCKRHPSKVFNLRTGNLIKFIIPVEIHF